jgi:Amt family ammonium transporter
LLLAQLCGVAVTSGWTAVATCLLLRLVSLFVPLRVSLQQELKGLDISQHGGALQ